MNYCEFEEWMERCEDLLKKNGMKFEKQEKILFMRRSVLIEYFYSTYFY